MRPRSDGPVRYFIRPKRANSTAAGPYSDPEKRVSQRKRTKSTRYAGDEYNWEVADEGETGGEAAQINMADEQSAWDFFYRNYKESNTPFSGFGTMETVNAVFTALSKLRGKKALYIQKTDVVLEVGHGKFPLVWDLRMFYPKFMYYGVEFSSVALEEAVKLRFGAAAAPRHVLDHTTEFLRATSPSYFNLDGSCNFDLIFPENAANPSLWPGTVSLAIGKSFLDYLSSRCVRQTRRLSRSLGVSDWALDPRIPQGVVDMFDSVCVALKEDTPLKRSQPVFIMVEPDDPVKYKDHVGIIAKVIYTATFVNSSPSKRFRLRHVHRDPAIKAVCYGLVKVGDAYGSYNALREDIYRVAAGLHPTQNNDEDWLLPYEVPPKWLSIETKDYDHLTILS